MTNERLSDERLAEMLADAISERDRPIIGDGSLYDFHPGELVIALTELQSLRSAREAEPVADEDRMQKISEVITHLQSVQDRFGDTFVYIRRGGMSWGAVALNRRDDDKKNGVFDLQAQHDREITARVQQVERLIADNRDLRARLAPHPSPSTEGLGIERAARIIARDCGGDNYGEDDWGVFVHVARSILSALSTSAEQVEITDEMVERARHAHADARDFGWGYVAAMHAALTAALSPVPDNQVEG